MSLENLASFVTAVDQGSLTGAAKVLGVPKSTVSRRLARLEETLGQQLVLRTSRAFRLTEAGEALYRRSAPALLDLDLAMEATRDAATTPVGALRVTAPVDLGSSAPFASAMARFAARWPRLRLSVDLSDRLVDLVAEGVDVACRLHTGPLEDRASLKVRRLMPLAMGLFATREYLERAGRPDSVSALETHALVRLDRGEHTGRPRGANPLPFFEELAPHEGGAAATGRSLGLTTSSMSFAAAAVASGAGIGLLPRLVAEGLPTPVEQVLPELELAAPTLSLVWPSSRQLSPRVRAFVDFMAETFEGSARTSPRAKR